MITEETTGFEPMTDLQLNAAAELSVLQNRQDNNLTRELLRRWRNAMSDLEFSEQGRLSILSQLDQGRA